MNERQTYGEKLVRKSFNPSQDNLVDEIKHVAADLIDLIHENKDKEPRCAALAITSIENGAMWAVKMATAEPGQPDSK